MAYVHDSGKLGGAGHILLHLLSSLNRDRFDPTVICGSEGPLTDRIRALDVPVSVVDLFSPEPIGRRYRSQEPVVVPRLAPFGRNLWRLGRAVRSLRAEFVRLDPDLIHGNGVVSNIAAACAALGRSHKIVWHLHGLQPKGVRFSGYTALGKAFVDRYIAVSEFIADSYRPAFGDRVRTVHNGLNPDLWDGQARRVIPRATVREELSLPVDAKIGLIASLLLPWKGQDIALQAVADVISKCPSFRFLVLGGHNSPEQEQYVQRLRDLTETLKISEHVHFMGYREDVLRLMRASDLLVSASVRPDPFPTVILEAMHAGLPVVATNIGGQKEMVVDGHTGRLVQPGSAREMAVAILDVLESERSSDMGERGRERVTEMFSHAQFIAGIEAVYTELCG